MANQVYSKAALKLLAKQLDACVTASTAARATRAGQREAVLELGRQIAAVEQAARAAMATWTVVARAEAGASWAEMADCLGLQKQTTYVRYRDVMQDVPLSRQR